MNISIIHHSLNPRGGAERLCLTTIEALKEKGHEVCLGTFEKTNWNEVEESFKDVVRPDKEIVVSRKKVFLGTYGEILQIFLLTSKMCKHSDVTIVSSVSPSWSLYGLPVTKKLVIYVHDPTFLSRKYRVGLWHFYYKPYDLIERKSLTKLKNEVILTNSSFSAKLIKKVSALNAKILYPPVDIENFFSSEKENLVVSVGRFDPIKKFEILIKSFTEVKDASCIIIGSSYGKESRSYILKLKSLIKTLGLETRIKLLVDCPFDTLKQILAKAKLYVHCMLFEHFGISIVEGMASGCIPIVHRSGGPYTDIVNYDTYGFSFKEVHELSDKINLLLENEDLQKEYSEKTKERSKMFSKEVFKKNILRIVELMNNVQSGS